VWIFLKEQPKIILKGILVHTNRFEGAKQATREGCTAARG
jgi:hypothetical protein